MNRKQLLDKIVQERAERILELDMAYPDVGMGISYSTARADAIAQLTNEGILPTDYKG